MMDKCIVSVGIGPGQTDFIRAVKNRGYLVAGFGKGDNDLEAIQLCDFCADIDTADADAAIEWLQGIPAQIVAAGSFAGGVAIKTLQLITNVFQLATCFDSKCIVGMNKIEQQKIYEQYHLSTIKTWMGDEIKAENIESGKQYIVKPCEGRGSKGVFRLSGAELLTQIDNEKIGVRDIVQEYFEGVEYRAVLFVQDGKAVALLPIKRISYKNTYFLGKLSYEESGRAPITEFAKRVIEQFHMSQAVLKFDVLVHGAEVNLIEMDVGVCGGIYFGEYLSALLDSNTTELYLDIILNQKAEKQRIKKADMIMEYIYNEKQVPIHYNLEQCKKKLQERYGIDTRIVVNRLHPEFKSGYSSNADFIFAVIHKNAGEKPYELNQFVNEHLFLCDSTA